jgi:serine/threonine protein kinase
MNRRKWKKIEELFNAALELPTEKRAAFLDSVCKDDELRSEVESLLENAEKEDSFLKKACLSLGLTILGEEKKYLLNGKKIGRYQITRLLGEGGMGEVYLADDLRLNRRVALKLLPSYLVKDDESVARFEKEAFAASSTSHPNIVHIYEAGIEGDRRFIAMEFIEGTTLRELIKQKKLDVITSLDIIWQTANALASAHQAGIIHRDIKPENIMIRRDGYVKVLDFGIAKLSELSRSEQKTNPGSKGKNQHSASQNPQATSPDLVMGTMGYISPEQLNNKNVDLRTDIWSLGVVLYEILSGNKPFTGKTLKEVRKAILHNNPPAISVSTIDSDSEAALQKILTKALYKRAADRYQSTSELSQELKELKQKLEFSQQFPTGEINSERSLPDSGTIEQTQDSSFITKSKLFWSQQSISQKALLLTVFVGIMTFAVGVSFQYLSRFYAAKASNFESFSPDSREKWQISTLFGIRKKLQGLIPSVSFSPDGKSIAFNMFAEGVDDIYVKRIDQSEPIKITDGVGKYQTPVWSPDGQQIAFVTNRNNKNFIWTIPAQGGTPVLKTNLAISTSFCELLKWSNDGKKLFFKSGQLLKTIDLDTGQISEIKFPLEKLSGAFSISQDESLIAFVSLDGEKQQLWVYNLKNDDLTEITEKGNFDLFPALLPDNKRLIFSSNQNGNYQLYITDFVSKKPTQLTFGDSNAYAPLISPNGNQIIYLSETNTANIFALEVNAKKEERITEATKLQLLPDLSNDQTNLVFQITDDNSNFESSPLRIRNLQTKSESVLENQKGYGAKWSPTKDEIVYLRLNGSSRNLWKTDLVNNQTSQLTFGDVGVEGIANSPFNLVSSPFDWSPDGTKIIFVLNQSKIPNVCTINSDGTNLLQLTNNDNQKKKYNSPIWSPDGNKIAFSHKIEIEPNKYQYGISYIANNQEKEVFRSELRTRLLGWEANGTNLLTSVRNKEEVEIYELSDAAAPMLLTKLSKAELYSLSLSPDGKTVVYSANRNGIDNIFSYTLNGKEKQLTDNREDTILFSGISWSPARDKIFYSKQYGGIQISMISDKPEKTE